MASGAREAEMTDGAREAEMTDGSGSSSSFLGRPAAGDYASSPTATTVRATAVREPCCTRQRAEASFDILTAAVSLADIVTDIFVAREFYNNGFDGFFGYSVALLLVAQLSYAFMFAGTFAPHHSAAGQALVFLLALPFGQLVPILTWVESLHLPRLARLLRALGLTPSSEAETAAGSATADADELWSAIQSKYRSHAGFLLEAIVEAVPQGLLQTVFVVVHGELTPLNALSLSFSLVVLCSKGWIFSYSLHRTTFVFNSLCIAADIVGLFASVCWLATPATVRDWWPWADGVIDLPASVEVAATSVPPGCISWNDGCNTCIVAVDGTVRGCTKMFCEQPGTAFCMDFAAAELANVSADYYQDSVSVQVHEEGAPWSWSLDLTTLGGAWGSLSTAGLTLSYTGGFALLLFAVFDDHLKLDIRRQLGLAAGASSNESLSLVRLYVYRSAGWLLALLPCSVIWLTARLSFLPVLVFHSFDPEHATRPAFYRRLYAFLRTGVLASAGGTTAAGPRAESVSGEASASDETAAAVTARLVAVNEWIAHARAAKPELLRRLATERREQELRLGPQRRASAVAGESAVVAAWGRIVGAEHRGGSVRHVAAEDEELDLESLLLILNQPAGEGDEHGDDGSGSEDTENPAAQRNDAAEDAAAARVRVRRALLVASIQQRRQAADADLLARSEIIRGLRNHETSTMRTGNCCLRIGGTVSLAFAAVLGAAWLPITAGFWVYSTLFPFLNFSRCAVVGGPDPGDQDADLTEGTELACALTAVQGCGVMVMLALLPAVRRWQALRMDLIGLGGFPACFYSEDTLNEMVRRAQHSLEQQQVAVDGRRAVRREQEQQQIAAGGQGGAASEDRAAFDSVCSICLEDLTDAQLKNPPAGTAAAAAEAQQVVVALPLCMHAFHKECIYGWLGAAANRSCPNCRANVVQTAAPSGGPSGGSRSADWEAVRDRSE